MSRWRRPVGARSLYGARPEPGVLVDHDFGAWRVLRVHDVPVDRWTEADREVVAAWPSRMADRRPYVVVLRPASVDVPWQAHDGDVHLKVPAGGVFSWWVLPEHYAVCARCGDTVPCREVCAEEEASAAVTRMGWYEVAGVCPACREPVTGRQESVTWVGNVEIPGGPPVTFHLRRRCRGAAVEYEERWVAADPAGRRARLSCPGSVVNHNDGTYECTELGLCPGPGAWHPSYTVCRCPGCHARGPFGCHPPVGAARAAGSPA